MPPSTMSEEKFKMFKESQNRPESPKGTICACAVCDERFASAGGKCPMTCKFCRTKEGRQAVYDNHDND